ncbi:MAG: SdpI family protein [Polyangiaceae bacterium]
MSRTGRTFDVISLIALGGLVAYTASVYDALPARVATHFDFPGNANDWMDRPYGTWGVDAFGLAMWAFVRFSPKWLPSANDWRKRAEQSPMAAVAMLTMLLFVGIGVFTVWNALHPAMPRMVVLDVLLGAYALTFAQILPRTRRNPILGIRTPFSLTSDENWLRANRVGAYAFAAGGLACIACGLAGAPAVGIVLFIVAAILPAIYSWFLAYRLPPGA